MSMMTTNMVMILKIKLPQKDRENANNGCRDRLHDCCYSITKIGVHIVAGWYQIIHIYIFITLNILLLFT